MRILLIQPPSNIMSNRKESKPALPPYGLACIAGYLRNIGYETQIYDMLAEGYYKENKDKEYIRYGCDEVDLSNKLSNFKPDIVGVSCIASLRHFEACDVIKWTKQYNPNIITAMGGNHPSSLPELVIKDCVGSLDYIIDGEGDFDFPKLLNGVQKKTKVISCESTINLDTLPVAAHDILPLDLYKKIWKETSYHFYETKKYTIMSTSRGCVNRCRHCPHNVVFGRGWRQQSVNRLLDEINWVVDELGVEEIQFHEYNGQVNHEYMMQLSKSIKKFNVRWGYPIGMWVKLLNQPLLDTMRESGMDYINLAIESPKKNVLDTMPGKNVDLNYVNKVIKWCNERDYYINSFFMIGYPDQTLEEMWETVEYAKSLDINTVAFFIVQPCPATSWWNEVEFIDGFHPMMIRYGKCNLKSDLWNPEEVEEIRHRGREEFVKSRLKVGSKLRGKDYVIKSTN